MKPADLPQKEVARQPKQQSSTERPRLSNDEIRRQLGWGMLPARRDNNGTR